MHTAKRTQDTTLEITPGGTAEPITVRGKLPSLHDDPQKIYQLLDLLGMPPGTEVKVTTVAASVIVR